MRWPGWVVLVGILIIVGVYSYGLNNKSVPVYQETVADCVESYIGRSVSFYDFNEAKSKTSQEISHDIGANTNVIDDCMGR